MRKGWGWVGVEWTHRKEPSRAGWFGQGRPGPLIPTNDPFPARLACITATPAPARCAVRRYEEQEEALPGSAPLGGRGQRAGPPAPPSERFRADRKFTARISPYLAWGELRWGGGLWGGEGGCSVLGG
jgi:hypothetical protein